MKINFIKYAMRHKRLYAISFSGLLLSVAFASLGPFFMGRVVDVIIRNDGNLFFVFALAMFLSYSLSGIFHYIEEFHSDLISKEVASDVRRDLFAWIQREDGDFFRRRSSADLMSRTTTDANNIGFAFGFCGIYTIEIIGIMLSMTVAILIVNPFGAIVPLALMPLIVVLSSIAEKRGDKAMDDISDCTANINQVASEAITGIRTVKAFGKEDLERRKFSLHNRRFLSLNNIVDFIWADWYSPVEAISRMMVLINILVCGLLVISNRLSLGEFTAIFQYTSQLSLAILDLGWLLRIFSQARAGARKINAIMEDEPRIKDGEKILSQDADNMEFRSVSFSVGDKKLLDNISFKVSKGKSVAIMGATGSGKSLIASLAVRFLDPTEGEILINGNNIRDLTLESTRKYSSIVTQDIFLFSNSVLDNIRLGQKGSVSKDECIAAAQKAKASEFIESLSNGYDTIIGERGVGLSGGQRQRLAIARALCKNCPLLILDDSTSALDMETEHKIEETINKDKNRSLLIIAHRVSAVAFADEILFLDNGRIAERGTHDELLKKKGLYYNTYISQYPEVR